MYYKNNHTIYKSNQSLKSQRDPLYFIQQQNINGKTNIVNNNSLPSCYGALEQLSLTTTQELYGTVESLTPLGVQELWTNALSAQSEMNILSDNQQCPPPYPIAQTVFFIP